MKKTKRGLPPMSYITDKKLYRLRGTYKGQKYSITAKEPEDVMTKIEAFKARVDSGIIDNGITLFQFVQRWYPLRIAGLKPKSVVNISNSVNNHILPKLGNIPIRDIKPMHIDELMAGLSDYSQSINQKVLVELNRIFNNAIENNIIVRNPCLGRKPGGKRPEAKIPLTVTEQEQLAIAVQGTRAELFVLLCLFAGLRREEALGLLWVDVHLDAKTPYIEVRNTTVFDSAGRGVHSTDLKTPSANRLIPLIPLLVEAMRKSQSTSSSAFVIPAVKTGCAMPLSSFKRMWAIAAQSVPFHIEPHILRHTYITQLCGAGMDVKKIQYLAGHSDPRVTMSIYAKVVNNTPGELAPAIVSAFSGIPTGTPYADKESLQTNKKTAKALRL